MVLLLSVVVNFDQLMGVAPSQNLVKILFGPFSNFFVDFRSFSTIFKFSKVYQAHKKTNQSKINEKIKKENKESFI